MKLVGYISYTTIDGLEIQRSPVEVGCLSHYLQVFHSYPFGGRLRTSKPWTVVRQLGDFEWDDFDYRENGGTLGILP